MTHHLHASDVLDALRAMPAGSSPPYFGLRSYLNLPPTRWSDGAVCCLGAEPTPAEFVRHIAEVRRVLRDDGVCVVNLGDTYSGGNCGGGSVFSNGRTCPHCGGSESIMRTAE